ncbi:substrate-binding periplasmic protein [Billgrantia gudaonensis]|uniref:Polar amino acid transport system substrate-binding protein n=1 Tax=Billgrantia gudaonensis TaxID=376427 RepID=A0A1G9A1A0_9GAMM|nr:transporter substrate-binding domain-containing protein [Halomonas gudaonensis]SDK21142.1 polar amino acid transport system substrate-binding protein [Halomonas gudaonensis]
MRKGLLWVACLLLPMTATAELSDLTFITEEYPPYNYQRGGQPEGIAVELLERIFTLTDTPLDRHDIQFYPWVRGYDTALTEPGTVLFSTTRTEQREPLFQWVGPIATDRVSLIARRDADIRLDDLDSLIDSDYRVAVIREDIGAQRLHEAGVPDSHIQVAMSNESALRMLERGRVDLWAYGEDVAFWLMEEKGLARADFEPVLPISESDLYFALHQDTDPDLVAAMQDALDRLRTESLPATPGEHRVTFNTEEYPPFNFLDEAGEIDGIATRLLQTALHDTGLTANFRLLPWARAYAEARLREDHCVYSTTRTPNRETHFTWIGPLAINEWAAFALAESDLEASELADLADRRVGSFREDAVGQYAEQQGISILLTSAERDNIGRLRAGVIDAWVTGTRTARQLAREADVELKRLFSFRQEPLYLACHPSVPDDYVAELQAALTQLTRSGRAETLRRQVLEQLEGDA